MALNANKEFKEFLKKELQETNKSLNNLYIRHLEGLISLSPVVSDIEILNVLKVSNESGITFSELRDLAMQQFSPIFKIVIQKNAKSFQDKVNIQLKALNELERLYSYYVDAYRFFNDFDSLENYLSKTSLPLMDEYQVLRYYLNCTFAFVLRELSLDNHNNIQERLKSLETKYDKDSIEQLKQYLTYTMHESSVDRLAGHFKTACSLVNKGAEEHDPKEALEAFWKLKLSLSPYHIALLITCYKDRGTLSDFQKSTESLQEKETEDVLIRARLLNCVNSN